MQWKETQDTGVGGSPNFPIYRQEHESQKDKLRLTNTHYWVLLCAGHGAKPNTVSVFMVSYGTSLLKNHTIVCGRAETRRQAAEP